MQALAALHTGVLNVLRLAVHTRIARALRGSSAARVLPARGQVAADACGSANA